MNYLRNYKKTLIVLLITPLIFTSLLFPITKVAAQEESQTITVNLVINGETFYLWDIDIDGIPAGTGINVSSGATTGTVTVPAGTHHVTVEVSNGYKIFAEDWTFTYSNQCANGVIGSDQDQVVCTITGTENGAVNVTKYNDLGHIGVKTANDPVLPGWQIKLDNSMQTTGSNGSTEFYYVTPGQHQLSEVQQSGWSLSNITCTPTNPSGLTTPASATSITSTVAPINLTFSPGEQFSCLVGNYLAAAPVTPSPPKQLVNTGQRITSLDVIVPLMVISLIGYINWPQNKKVSKK